MISLDGQRSLGSSSPYLRSRDPKVRPSRLEAGPSRNYRRESRPRPFRQASRQRSAGEDTSRRKHGGQDSNNEDGKLIAMLKTEIDEQERELAVKRKENVG